MRLPRLSRVYWVSPPLSWSHLCSDWSMNWSMEPSERLVPRPGQDSSHLGGCGNQRPCWSRFCSFYFAGAWSAADPTLPRRPWWSLGATRVALSHLVGVGVFGLCAAVTREATVSAVARGGRSFGLVAVVGGAAWPLERGDRDLGRLGAFCVDDQRRRRQRLRGVGVSAWQAYIGGEACRHVA